jgi:hypothetical protein
MYRAVDTNRPFTYQGTYPCPVCRLNELKAISLMEAMACDCCRHIFTADLDRQQLKIVDRQPSRIWYWTGKTWKGLHREGAEWGWISWLFAVGFVVLPTTIIGLATYIFPPEPGSPLSWFPTVWFGLTFLSHFSIIVWLVTEYYQFPVRVYLRVRFQQFFGRVISS